MTLNEIVDNYIRESRPHGQAEARFFKTLASLAEAISHAVRPGGRKHSHQYLIPTARLDEAERCLLRIAPELAQATDFSDLLGLVEREAGSIHGIGDLTVYDVAHRLGMHLHTAPDLVYLHRGTKKRAAVLGFRGKVLDPKMLPSVFSRLSAAEIEDCLCIYHRELLGSGAPRLRHPAATSRCVPDRPHARSAVLNCGSHCVTG
jgi:hypothetical protein